MTVVTVHVVEWTLCTETINVSFDSLRTYYTERRTEQLLETNQLSAVLSDVCAVLQHISVLWLLTWLCLWCHHTRTFAVFPRCTLVMNFKYCSLCISWPAAGNCWVWLHGSRCGICPVMRWQWLAGLSRLRKLVWSQYLACKFPSECYELTQVVVKHTQQETNPYVAQSSHAVLR